MHLKYIQPQKKFMRKNIVCTENIMRKLKCDMLMQK